MNYHWKKFYPNNESIWYRLIVQTHSNSSRGRCMGWLVTEYPSNGSIARLVTAAKPFDIDTIELDPPVPLDVAKLLLVERLNALGVACSTCVDAFHGDTDHVLADHTQPNYEGI